MSRRNVNIEARRAAYRRFYLRHKADVLARNKAYRTEKSYRNPKSKEHAKRYYWRNRDKILAKSKEKRIKNPAKWTTYLKTRRKLKGEEIRRKAREYVKRRCQTEPEYKLLHNIRVRLWKALRSKRSYKNNSCLKLLGCSISDFKIYLESRFESGMSWENYGRDWHIDHIMPCAIFDLTNPEHQKRCFHFSNLQPMWATKNLRKGARLHDNQFRLL